MGTTRWIAAVAVAAVAVAGTASAAPATRGSANAKLVSDIALARQATAKYVDDLALAKANGYAIITKMIPNMGYHYMNPKITGFDVRRPPILVYEHNGPAWQLGALEWVYTKKPAKAPLPGATYGTFGAGCHYKDGTFVPAQSQDACPATAPQTGAAFNFWHPLLFTLHFWIWSPNPAGLYSGTNPLAAAYNKG